jgi:hypothetical protein
MTDRILFIFGRHCDFDGLESWLERYERFWVPLAALMLLALIGFVLVSTFHFYLTNSTPFLPAEW